MERQENPFILKAKFAYWAGTIRRWLAEGLPEAKQVSGDILDSEPIRDSKAVSPQNAGRVDANVIEYFDMDSYLEKFPFDISPL